MTPTETITSALETLARNIHTDDGVANACIIEAADRLRELDAALGRNEQPKTVHLVFADCEHCCGESFLSAWATPELANSEVERLGESGFFFESVTIKEEVAKLELLKRQRDTAIGIAKKLMVFGIEGGKCISELQALEEEVAK